LGGADFICRSEHLLFEWQIKSPPPALSHLLLWKCKLKMPNLNSSFYLIIKVLMKRNFCLIPTGTRRRFDVEISSKWSRDVDRLNIDVVSTSPSRRIIDVVYNQRCFDVALMTSYRRCKNDVVSTSFWRRCGDVASVIKFVINTIGWSQDRGKRVFSCRYTETRVNFVRISNQCFSIFVH
jgi:hypothetical protein